MTLIIRRYAAFFHEDANRCCKAFGWIIPPLSELRSPAPFNEDLPDVNSPVQQLNSTVTI